jgi:hypothetical protein
MSYLKLIAVISKFFQENKMENPLVPDVLPTHALLQELRIQALVLMRDQEKEQEQNEEFKDYFAKTISFVLYNFYEPVCELLEIFYAGDIVQRKLFIEAYRNKHGLTPLFDSFPTQDRLTGAISHAFDMAKAEYAIYEQFRSKCTERAQKHGDTAWTPEEREKERLMRAQFEYTQNYAYRMVDVLETTYMS